MGRLEVCVVGCWGTVCGNDFDALDATVACRQLGFIALGTFLFPISHFSVCWLLLCIFFLSRTCIPGVSPPYYGYGRLYSLSCNGNETSLFDCPHYDNGYYTINGPTNYSNHYGLCGHSSDIGIICPGLKAHAGTKNDTHIQI